MSNDLMQRATQRHQAGDLAGAEPLYRQLLAAQPGHADGWQLLGVLLGATGRHAEALEAIRRAIALRGNDAAFHNNLGEVQRGLGRLDEAEAAYRRALALRPELAEAHYNLGNVLKTQGQHDEAIACYRRAIELRPGYAKAHYNLANAQREQGRVKDAVAAYRQAVALVPSWADAHLNLGVALADLDEPEAAIASFRRAADLDPQADVDGGLGNAYADLGRLAEAGDAYGRELARYPERWVRRLRIAGLAEPVPQSNAAIDAYRAGLITALDRVAAEAQPGLDLEKLHGSGAEPPMILAYQGRDDRPLKERYAALFTGRLPTMSSRRNDGPPHVGFVVTHGHEGVFFKCMGGLVDRLPEHGLHVTVVCCRSGRNILAQWMRHPELRYQVIPERVDQAAEAVAAAGYDVLYYWEVGTDSLNYFLPFTRPAPVQCAGWGWPVTSGNPAIDYFVSGDLLEPDGGETHYTERLVRLQRLPTWYRRPPVPERLKPREHFGLDPQSTLYLCTQNLRKCHPDFDPLVAGILRADPRGRFVLLADRRQALTEGLLRRMRGALGEVGGRVQALPRLPEADYLNLVALADVVLDTPHYGGGVNTIYDAFAAGTPVVTLPGAWHRGRWALAAYQRLGIVEGVAADAADYVRIAVRLGSEPDARQALGRCLREAAGELFESAQAVSEHAEFFRQAAGSPW